MELLENQGFTNKTFRNKEKNTFIKQKFYDSFNHKIDYKILNVFKFSPKVIEDNKDILETEWIEGKTLGPNDKTKERLEKIGKMLITIHNSKLPFPKQNDLSRCFKTYLAKIKKLNKKVPTVSKYYKKINLFLKNIDTSAPCHNDLWLFNMIEDKNKNIFLVDWEYASMGDVHFDLAYFIESSELTKEEEKMFLKAYGDDYEEKYLLIHKILVNALIVLWVNKHAVNPFSDTLYNNKIEKYMKEYLEKYKN